MEAGLADKEVTAVFEPREHGTRERADLVIRQVHEEPIGEDDVEFVSVLCRHIAFSQFQLGHIGLNEIDVRMVAVALTVALHVVSDKVDGGEARGARR